MVDEVKVSQKKRRTPLDFFRSLGFSGKFIFVLSLFIFFSLIVCAGLLFWFQRGQEGLEISLRDLVEDSVEELTPAEAFENPSLGYDAGISEDGCQQKIFKVSAVEKTQDGWLCKVADKKVYIPFSCSPSFNASQGEEVFVRLEMCRGASFVDCFNYIGEFSGGKESREFVRYYVEKYPADGSRVFGGFYSPGLDNATEDSPQLFLKGELAGVADREFNVRTDYGVVPLGSGRTFTQAIGEEEVREHSLEAAQNFIGSDVIVWVGLTNNGGLSLEKFAVTQ